jgi:phosphoglycolate phosphatase
MRAQTSLGQIARGQSRPARAGPGARPARARAGRGGGTLGGGRSLGAGQAGNREDRIHRLVLWNIDLTLVDVARVSRDACADAFRQVTGRPLVALPQMAGKSDSEIFFEALALNQPSSAASGHSADLELLDSYTERLAASFAARRALLTQQGRALPGAVAAVTAVARLAEIVQTVLTGTIRANAAVKLDAFGMGRFFDAGIGGYGSDIYPKGAQVLRIRERAAEKYGTEFAAHNTVYLADSSRDVDAARMGGIRSIAVASGRSTAAELREVGADVVLADLVDTAGVIAAIGRLTTTVAAG